LRTTTVTGGLEAKFPARWLVIEHGLAERHRQHILRALVQRREILGPTQDVLAEAPRLARANLKALAELGQQCVRDAREI